ncbi:glycosyltransferase [Thermodesulfovibrionales bacterium]|nr:glycosyltransferase [Thermodesulfovibrionales bacterium]
MRIDIYLLKTLIKNIKNKIKSFYPTKAIYDRINIIYDYKEYFENKKDNRQYLKTIAQEKIKRALLSYLVAPLKCPKHKRDRVKFSNLGIAQCIPRVLNELGYVVDIVNYDNITFVPRRNYNLFIGHGGVNYDRIAKKLPSEIPQIYFSTGTYWKTWNAREKERFNALLQRRGVELPFDRVISASEEYANRQADGIICLGNEYARETYRDFPLVLHLNNAVFPSEYNFKHKDYEYGRNRFLFFNGPGNIHKGLDLVLEAFSKLRHSHIYICQHIESEFAKVYKKELNEYQNIHLCGWIEMRSHNFYEIVNKCNYVISATCVEGQPGSVIECMAHGLIPVISKEANIDVKKFGIILKENTIEEIINVVNGLSQKSAEWCRKKSKLVLSEIAVNYSENHFLEAMKKAIQIIIKKPGNFL